jgi:hypothetical protein
MNRRLLGMRDANDKAVKAISSASLRCAKLACNADTAIVLTPRGSGLQFWYEANYATTYRGDSTAK